ncbi:MAG: prolyl oligopeptidase family serine peptidase [Actinomycetota bacterium]
MTFETDSSSTGTSATGNGTNGAGGASGISAVEAFPKMYAKTRRFSVGVPRNITAISEGRVLFLRSKNGNDPTLCLWLLNPDTGREEVLVDPAALVDDLDNELPAAERARRERARESGAGIVSYSVDPAGRTVCFSLAGTLCVFDVGSGELTMPEVSGAVFDPRVSPDGTKVAFVVGAELRMLDLAPEDPNAASTVSVLAAGGGDEVGYGRAEFIAAEEMQRSRGFWWSPRSDQLLVTRVDEAHVTSWWIADPAHPDRQPNQVRYPAAGSANAQVDLLLVDLNGDRRTISWDDDGRYEYLANVVWTSDNDPLVVRQTRDQREVSIAALDTESLGLREQRRITDDIWVELIPSSPTVSEHGMLTVEDLTSRATALDLTDPGRRALLLDGRPRTGHELNVRSIVGAVGEHALVTAWTEPTEVHLFLIDLTGDRSPMQLTTNPGVHTAVIGRGGRDGADDNRLPLVVTSARPAADGIEVAVRPLTLPATNGDGDPAGGSAATAGEDGDDEAFERRPAAPGLGAPLRFIEDESLRPPITAAPLFCKLGADRLESALFLPTGFQGDRELPVLLDPYGGPHAQRVLKNQTSHLVSQWFADQGFAVLVTDGRGTPGRGPEWERQVWGDLATPVLEDQLAALDAAAEDFDVLDLERVAIRGWSFGGYLAALAAIRRPDRFHAAVAGAPVTTWRLYDTHYTERYLGRPDLHPRHYDTTDLTTEAADLARPLLLIHGLADDNVVAAHTLQLSTALLGAAVPHQVLPLSGVTHMTPQEAVAENLLWLQLDFIREALGLGGGNPPAPMPNPEDGRP